MILEALDTFELGTSLMELVISWAAIGFVSRTTEMIR